MYSKTIVILGAGIGGIVTARRSSKEGGVCGVIRPRFLGKRVAVWLHLNVAGKTS
jgi:hypothetical protein